MMSEVVWGRPTAIPFAPPGPTKHADRSKCVSPGSSTRPRIEWRSRVLEASDRLVTPEGGDDDDDADVRERADLAALEEEEEAPGLRPEPRGCSSGQV